MKLRIIYTFFFLLLLCPLMFLLTGYSSGPASENDTGYTGAPGDNELTCGSCHDANAFGAVAVTLTTTDGNEATFNSGNVTSIEVTVTAAMGTPSGYGFQMIAFNADDTPLDVTYMNLSDNLKETITTSGRKYLEHNAISTSNTFTFDFEPNMATGTEIRFHVAANAVNDAAGNNGDSGSEGLVFTIEQTAAFAVELSDFNTSLTRRGIELNWVTETEQDNDYFLVEHATNGVDFSAVKTIRGAGTSQGRNSYTYMHDTPVNGTNYYRLRMVEFSGKVTYSDVLVEKFYTSGTIMAYPQPATAQAKIHMYSAVEEAGTLSVYDLAGKLIFTKDINIKIGKNLIDLDCSQWIPANYIIILSGEQFYEEVQRFVVSR